MNGAWKRVGAAALNYVLPAVLFVSVTVLLRGQTISFLNILNSDEAELMAQARAAMISPVPFTTWTMGTTGPIWVQFIALLGLVGFPMTIVFAHLLAAVLVGFIGFVVFLLFRRNFGLRVGVVISVLWWLPIALIFPIAGRADFGALSTELLPTLLVLLSALFSTKTLLAKPWLFAIAGALCGLAVLAKYQALPVALGLVAVQLIALKVSFRRTIPSALWWAAGAALPCVLVVAEIVTSPQVNYLLVQQNLGFLGSYAGGLTLQQRIVHSVQLLLTQKYLIGAVGIVVWLCILSTRRVVLSRLIVIGSGLLAIFAGGMGYGHYLLLLFAALAIATSLPMAEGARLLPSRTARAIVLPALAAVTAAVMVVGAVSGRFTFSSPRDVAMSLSKSSVLTEASLAVACPPQSKVFVWGWDPELYVNYSWRNTVPFMTNLGITSNPQNYELSRPMIRAAISTSDCVIDAVGAPFLGDGPQTSLTLIYPETTASLFAKYRVVPNAVSCDACTVYVRK